MAEVGYDAGAGFFQVQSKGEGHIVNVSPTRGPGGGWQSYAVCSCGEWKTVHVFPHLAMSAARAHFQQVATTP